MSKDIKEVTKLKKFLLIFIVSILVISNVNAKVSPSFDCAKATTEVEKLICSDEKLAQLDVEMNQAYNKFMLTLEKKNKKKLTNKQNIWLKNRGKVICMKDNSIKEQESCLSHVYQTRIKNLNNWSSRADWSFFIDDSFYRIGPFVKFLSRNGEEYIIGRSTSQTEPSLVYVLPEMPEEKVTYYYDNSYKLSNVINKITIDEIVISSLKEPNSPEKRSIEVRPFPKNRFLRYNQETMLKKITAAVEKDTMYGDMCQNFVNKMKNNEFKVIEPIAYGNSYEELQSKYDMGCKADQMLTNTLEGTKVSLLPPYTLYKVNNRLMLASSAAIVHNSPNPTNPSITTGGFFGRDGRWIETEVGFCGNLPTIAYGVGYPIIMIETDEGKYFLWYGESKDGEGKTSAYTLILDASTNSSICNN